MIGAALVTVPQVETAVRDHIQTWINDYLGIFETIQGIPAGTIPRPNGYGRVNEWPGDLVAACPHVVVVSPGTLRMRKASKTTVATLDVRVAVVCKGDGGPDGDALNAARAYAQSVALLMESKPSLLPGVTVTGVSDVSFADGEDERARRLSSGRVSLAVDAPLLTSDLGEMPGWSPTPGAGTPAPPPPATPASSVHIDLEEAAP